MSDRLSMPDLNRVTLAGRLTMDPDHLVLPSGQERTRLRIACNRRFRNRSGELQVEEGFFSVVVWNRVAALCKEYLSKASPVLIEGRLHQSRWVTEGGETRDAVEVVATRVHFLGRPIEDAAPECESVESEVMEA
jgi:single-strand DNA-binding protein